MALNDTTEKPATSGSAPAGGPAPAAATSEGGAPVWIVPAYLGGLVFVYIGERVLSGFEQGSWVVTAFGLALVMFSTALRFSPKFRARGDRRRIENMMAALSVVGVVAVVVYFASSEAGQVKLGLDKMAEAKRERVLGILQVVWTGLLLLSTVPMVFAQTALYPMRNAERPESRRVRSAAAAGLSLALAAVYGALFVFSAASVDLRVDYSYFKTSQPSESTKKIVSDLTDSIKITAFFPQVNDVKTEVASYLHELGAQNKKLKVDVKDRLLEPKLARDLRANQDGVIVLTKDDTHRSVVIGTNMDEARAKLKTLDRDFQEQLLKLARSRRTAYFTVGHGELNDTKNPQAGRGASVVRMVLQKQNYTIKDLGLAQGLANDIPKDAEIVFILGPAEPFAPEELGTLKRYAERGGKLFIALDPDALSTSAADTGVDDMGLPDLSEGPDAKLPGSKPGPGEPPKPENQKPDAKKPDPHGDHADEKKPDAKKPEAKAPETKKPETAKPEETGPTDPRAVALDSLAHVVGLEFQADVLANDKQYVRRRFNDSDKVMLYTTSFSSHAAVSTLSRNAPRAAIVTYGAGSLKRAPGNEKVDFAVRAMSGTFPDKNHNFKQDSETEKSGVFQLGAAVSKALDKDAAKEDDKDAKKADKDDKKDDKSAKKDDKKKKDEEKKSPRELRAFVLADSDAISDWILERAQGNVVMFVDAVRWLGGEESWSGEVNTEEDVRIEHTKQEDLAWFYATIFGAPALVLAGGLVFTQRSRKRGGRRK
jgi:hypothetical protein